MTPELTDNFMLVAPAGAETYMASPGKAIGATTFNINSATGWPTTTGFIVAIRSVDQNGNEIPGTYTEWVATLSGTTISLGTSPSPVSGADQVYASGSNTQVYIPLSSTRDNRLVNTILSQHNQNGSHGAITATSLSATGNVTAAAFVPSTAVFLDGTTNATYRYVVQSADTSNGYMELQFPHGLTYIPWVTGQIVDASGTKHPLPWIRSSNKNYYSSPAPYDIWLVVDRVDGTYIYVNSGFTDAGGLSIMATNASSPGLQFQFWCYPQP